MRVERSADLMVVEVASEPETERFGRAMAGVLEAGVVVGLVGGLGAGKTRLVRAVAEALGAESGAIASPTFVLIHEYEARLPVYHFDTYRLDDPDAFDALGASEYFEGPGVCFVEWADRVADRLPTGAWRLEIEPTGPESRRLLLQAPADRLDRIASALAADLDDR